MAGFRLGCGETIDVILDDVSLQFVQDVTVLLDLLGNFVSYQPRLDQSGQPVFMKQEPLAA